MDFANFLDLKSNLKQIELPGDRAHLLLVPPDRLKKIKDHDRDKIVAKLSENQIVDGDWKEKFFDIIKKLINEKFDYKECQVIIVVGINGSGKTTSCGKLAKFMLNNNEKVLLVVYEELFV